MSISLQAIRENFGGKIEGVHLPELSSGELQELKNLLYQYKFLLIKGQTMTPREYIQFAKTLGDPIPFVDANYRHPEFPEIFVVSNVKQDGKKIGMDRVGYYWHSDSSFLKTPLPITMLFAQQVPNEGGETAFIDMQAVYQSLPQELKETLAKKVARHEGQWRYIITEEDVGFSIQEILERDRQAVPPVYHPAVTTHPITKQPILYLNEGFTTKILDLGDEEGSKILEDLFMRIRSSNSLYVHHWEPGDIVFWDNRSTVHKAAPAQPGQPRMLFRIGIQDGPFYL